MYDFFFLRSNNACLWLGYALSSDSPWHNHTWFWHYAEYFGECPYQCLVGMDPLSIGINTLCSLSVRGARGSSLCWCPPGPGQYCRTQVWTRTASILGGSCASTSFLHLCHLNKLYMAYNLASLILETLITLRAKTVKKLHLLNL